jgi:hypothetical protein
MLILLLLFTSCCVAQAVTHQCHDAAIWNPQNVMPLLDGNQGAICGRVVGSAHTLVAAAKLVNSTKNGKVSVQNRALEAGVHWKLALLTRFVAF